MLHYSLMVVSEPALSLSFEVASIKEVEICAVFIVPLVPYFTLVVFAPAVGTTVHCPVQRQSHC